MNSDTAVHAHNPLALIQGQMARQSRGSGPSSAPCRAIVRMAVSQAFLASYGSGPSSAQWGTIVRMAVSQAFLASCGSGPSSAP